MIVRFLIILMLISHPLVSSASPVSAPYEISVWDRIKIKIANLVPKKQILVTTTSAGVRGDILESDDLYWKDHNAIEIDVDELKSFNVAMDLVNQGNSNAASVAFKKFLYKYPKSQLTEEAKEALRVLSKESAKNAVTVVPRAEATDKKLGQPKW